MNCLEEVLNGVTAHLVHLSGLQLRQCSSEKGLRCELSKLLYFSVKSPPKCINVSQ